VRSNAAADWRLAAIELTEVDSIASRPA
jgi:hypothetical protein